MAWPILLPIVNGVSKALSIPALAAFLAGLAANILSFFTQRMARSIAINLTVITLIVGITLTAATAIYAIGAGLSYVAPPYVLQAWGMVVPSNAVPCISAIFAARVVRWVWSWQFYVITKMAS
ncbi:DUF5455 family protein [Vibrio cincinnatiensis]